MKHDEILAGLRGMYCETLSDAKVVAAAISAIESQRWQPIESAPKYKEVLVYRKDAGVMLGIFTSPDQYVSEHEWDKVAAELGDAFDREGWFLFCWDGTELVEGDEVPTHWRLPAAPEDEKG